jgi:hypothetical protein
MDVLPMLTPRFLGYRHHRDDDSNDVDPQMNLWHKLDVGVVLSTPSPSDNTDKYLTERWSHDAVSDIILPISPYQRPLPANDVDAVPMWISPTTSLLPTPASSFSPPADLPSQLRTVSSLAVPPLTPNSTELSFPNNCLMDVPTVIFIRLERPEAGDHLNHRVITPAYGMFVEENDDVVSVLADNPDDDDVAVLPLATYDVLANIFDEIYKDESEVDDKDADNDDFVIIRS